MVHSNAPSNPILEGMKSKANYFYQTAYYKGYFNVTTDEVLYRLRKALWPFCAKKKLLEEDRYDLYGPIWIMITLIVEMTIVGFVNY